MSALASGIDAHRQYLSGIINNPATTTLPVETRPNIIKTGIQNTINKIFPKKKEIEELPSMTAEPTSTTIPPQSEEAINSNYLLGEDLKQQIYDAVVKEVLKYEDERVRKIRMSESQERLNKLNNRNDKSERDVDDIAVECDLIKDTPEARAGFRNTARNNPEAVQKMLKEAMEKKSRINAAQQLELINIKSPKSLEERGKEIYNRLISGSLDKDMAIMPSFDNV